MFLYFNSHKDRCSPVRFDDKNIDTLLACNMHAFAFYIATVPVFSVNMMHSKSGIHLQSWPPYQIRYIARCACAEGAGTFSPPPTPKKPLLSDLDIHHGTCVSHVPWCMSGSRTRGGGMNVPGIPSACSTRSCTYLARGPLGNKCGSL